MFEISWYVLQALFGAVSNLAVEMEGAWPFAVERRLSETSHFFGVARPNFAVFSF